MNLLIDATLQNAKQLFPPPFVINTYESIDELLDLLPHHELLVCRSTLKITPQQLSTSSIQCIATASSGVDHIDVDYLKKHNITLFDAKGCNAQAVVDYVTACILWLETHQKIQKKQAGIIGMGHVGGLVREKLLNLGFEVMCCDPIKAQQDHQSTYVTLHDLKHCDVLLIHANLHNTTPYPSKNLINDDFLNHLKPNCIIINASRGGIVDEHALLKTTKNIIYCTDVYEHEPQINQQIVDFATLCTPHIAGHTIEAKLNIMRILSQKIHTHYGLTPPKYPKTPVTTPLTPYNPAIETMALKNGQDLTETFLQLRKAHVRHEY